MEIHYVIFYSGESDPQQRTWKSESDEIIPAEAKNLCFYGTFVLNGNGIACVIATGNNTFMGRTAALASYTEENVTPLMIEINNLVMKLSIFASCIGLAVFIPAMVISTELWMRNLMILISLIITNIPGGLLIVTCIQLTLTAKILYRKNVQIKQLGSVETLGSTNVICSDKTGTLTTNIMTVQHIYFNLKDRICDTINPLHALRGDFYRHESEMTPERDTSSSPRPQIDNTLRNIRRPKDEFLRLIRCGALCNNANFLEETGDMDPTANATEAAILKFSSGHIISHYKQNINEYRRLHRKLHEIPFNSKNKWQVSIHQLPISPFMNIGNVSNVVSQQSVSIGGDIDDETKDQDSGPESKRQCIIQMKGAPERILNLCDKYVVDGEIMDLDEEVREQIMNDILALGAKGERVLAFCELTLDSYHYDINIEEPEIEAKYEEVIDEACNDKDVVMIDFEGKKYKISIDLDVVNRDKDEDDKVTFESVMIQDLMKLIEQQMNDEYHVYIPMGSQRIAYGDHGSALDEQLTFKELGIKQGSLIYLLRGPYRFKGTCINDVNFPFNREQDKEGLVFIGLFAMIDPPRPGVPEAVKTCQEAGIKVIMVTGDHPVTAKAIAEKVGIINEDKSENTLIYDRNNLDKDQFKEGKFEGIVVPGWELQHVLDQEPDDPQGIVLYSENTLKTL